MSQQPSGYDSFDLLNYKAAASTGGHSPARQPSGFSSALSSINQFLQTATNTIVTVDGVINKDKTASTHQRQLYPGQHLSTAAQSKSMLTYLVVAGAAIGGSLLVYNGFKNRR